MPKGLDDEDEVKNVVSVLGDENGLDPGRDAVDSVEECVLKSDVDVEVEVDEGGGGIPNSEEDGDAVVVGKPKKPAPGIGGSAEGAVEVVGFGLGLASNAEIGGIPYKPPGLSLSLSRTKWVKKMQSVHDITILKDGNCPTSFEFTHHSLWPGRPGERVQLRPDVGRRRRRRRPRGHEGPVAIPARRTTKHAGRWTQLGRESPALANL